MAIVYALNPSIDLTAPPTDIGTVTPPAIIVGTIFRSANSGNVPAVFQASGTSGFQLQQTDSTVTGGNARGAGAVDLQVSRSVATQVASAANSFAAGVSNTASGTQSVAIGSGNTASNTHSVAMGVSNIASGGQSFAIGSNNTASGGASIAMGTLAFTKGVSNLFCLGSQGISIGKSQINILNTYIETTTATPTVLRSNTVAASVTNQLVLQNNSALVVEGLAIATITGAGDTSSWKIVATIKRGATAASTVLVGSTVTLLHQNAGASAWALAITADTTNGCLAATVTNDARTVRVNLSLFASEVAF